MRKTIGIDFDDVVVDTIYYKRKYLQERGVNLENPDEYLQVKRALYRDLQASLEYLNFKEGAVESIHKLLQLGFKVKIVTLRGLEESKITGIMLNQANLDLPIISVGQGNSKIPFVLDCDVFVDDDPLNLIEMIGTVNRLYLMTTEENSDFINEKIIRVNSWEELLKLLVNEP